MTLGEIQPATVQRGGSFVAKIPLHLKAGFHSNSNTPNEDYLIPLKLTWAPGPIQVEAITYPKPSLENYSFSQKPVSVFSGTFVIETKFKAPANSPAGSVKVNGKLRYQACSERECLPPKTIEIQIPVEVQ